MFVPVEIAFVQLAIDAVPGLVVEQPFAADDATHHITGKSPSQQKTGLPGLLLHRGGRLAEPPGPQLVGALEFGVPQTADNRLGDMGRQAGDGLAYGGDVVFPGHGHVAAGGVEAGQPRAGND